MNPRRRSLALTSLLPRPARFAHVLGGIAVVLVCGAASDAVAQAGVPQATDTAMRESSPSPVVPGTPEPQVVRIQFTVCEVAAAPGRVDEECGVFQQQVHYSFGTMILREQQATDVELGGAADLSIGGSSLLEVMPITVSGARLNMQVQMPGIVNARMQLMLGRSTIFVGQRNGTNLLIGVTPAFEPVDLSARRLLSSSPLPRICRRRSARGSSQTHAASAHRAPAGAERSPELSGRLRARSSSASSGHSPATAPRSRRPLRPQPLS